MAAQHDLQCKLLKQEAESKLLDVQLQFEHESLVCNELHVILWHTIDAVLIFIDTSANM